LEALANAFVFGVLGDRVNYVVTIKPAASPVQRAAAIAYCVIADNFDVECTHAGDD
jgi:hypothetical protein